VDLLSDDDQGIAVGSLEKLELKRRTNGKLMQQLCTSSLPAGGGD
jgi:hypothetical protein